jgi:hypothetical protein
MKTSLPRYDERGPSRCCFSTAAAARAAPRSRRRGRVLGVEGAYSGRKLAFAVHPLTVSLHLEEVMTSKSIGRVRSTTTW